VIPHSQAFIRLKSEAQSVFDFAIVVSYAVPALKYSLRQTPEDSPIPFSPEHFDSRPIATAKVRENAKEYKKLLSRYVLLSAFSFFEAYFHDLLKEVIEFHGRDGLRGQVGLAHNLALTQPEDVKAKRKLQEYPKMSETTKHKKYGRQLAEKGFRFPSTLLGSYGLEKLIELADAEYIPASRIPELVQSIFQLPLDPVTEVEPFSTYREQRNRIAHGRADMKSLHLGKAVEANNFLRNLALKIDKHVVEHFLLIEAI
jgi:hypothetical protein